MKRVRSFGAGLLLLTPLLTGIAAARPPDIIAADSLPMASTQPIANLRGGMLQDRPNTEPTSESGLLVLVGSALIGLASIVKRSTRA